MYTESDFFRDFPDDDSCLEYLFKINYEKNCACGGRFYRVSTRKTYVCSSCGNQISPTVKTIFERSRTPLSQWFYIIFLYSNRDGNLNAVEISRSLLIKPSIAFSILEKINSLGNTLFIEKNDFSRNGILKKFYLEDRKNIIGYIKSKIYYKNQDQDEFEKDCEDIFSDAFVVLLEDYIEYRKIINYQELKRILFGIVKIKIIIYKQKQMDKATVYEDEKNERSREEIMETLINKFKVQLETPYSKHRRMRDRENWIRIINDKNRLEMFKLMKRFKRWVKIKKININGHKREERKDYLEIRDRFSLIEKNSTRSQKMKRLENLFLEIKKEERFNKYLK